MDQEVRKQLILAETQSFKQKLEAGKQILKTLDRTENEILLATSSLLFDIAMKNTSDPRIFELTVQAGAALSQLAALDEQNN